MEIPRGLWSDEILWQLFPYGREIGAARWKFTKNKISLRSGLIDNRFLLPFYDITFGIICSIILLFVV